MVGGLLKASTPKFWGVVRDGRVGDDLLLRCPGSTSSPVKSIRYRPAWHKLAAGRLRRRASSCSATSASSRRRRSATLVSQIGTLLYFGFFLLMPWWSRIGEFKPVPDARDLRRRTEPTAEPTNT
ncbi:MAG: hypothetical protein MZW92_68905 [Comamonadaceae bacterium]|nr:hypothetical protein [Comamonadaceae bacterium]